MNSRAVLWKLFHLAGLLLGTTRAATLSLEPEADARIIDIPGSYQTTNYKSDILSVYSEPGNMQRTLIRFDLTSLAIPVGEQIYSAELSLVASLGFGGSQGRPTEVYRVTQPWSEAGLTWLARDTGILWASPGGEYVGRNDGPEPYSVSTASPGQGQRVSWLITELVDRWVEEDFPNYGLLLRSYTGNGLTFVQRENSDSISHPALVITTAKGAPRLRAEVTEAGQALLSWRGVDVGLLEENTQPISTGWVPTAGIPTVVNGRSEIKVQAAGITRFYRLKQ